MREARKESIVLVVILSLLFVGLSGCITEQNNEQGDYNVELNRFIGTWKRPISGQYSETIIFFSDGTCSAISLSGTAYEIKEGKLVFLMYIEGNLFQTVYDYYFSNNNTTLTLTSLVTGESQIYTKQ